MIDLLINLLFPKRCVGCKSFGSYLCSYCFASIEYVTSFVCPVCERPCVDGATHPACKGRFRLDGASSGVEYKRVIKRLLYAFKYKPFLSDLKSTIGEILHEGVIQNESLYYVAQYKPVVTCVPLHSKKLKLRGYNHAALLADILASYLKLKFVENMLIRAKDTMPQFKLKKDERVLNVKDAFLFNQKYKELLVNKKVLLVDDLATTFSTLSECARVLKRNGASFVWGLTFARES